MDKELGLTREKPTDQEHSEISGYHYSYSSTLIQG